MNIQAIIFDCDGVLVDSEYLIMKADLAFLKDLGIAYSPEDYHHKFVGRTAEENMVTLTQEIQRVSGQMFTEELAQKRAGYLQDSLKNDLLPLEGASDFIKSLDVKKAVASNTTYTHWLSDKMKFTGLYDLFAPHIYAAEVVERGKPAPDLYLYAAARLGVAPEHCLVIEDSPTGATAAVAAGMHTIGFVGASDIPDGHVEKLLTVGVQQVFSNFTDVRQYVETLQGETLKHAV